MPLATAYIYIYIYIECSEGTINPVWKLEKPLSFWDFRDKLRRQLIKEQRTKKRSPVSKKKRSDADSKSVNLSKRKGVKNSAEDEPDGFDNSSSDDSAVDVTESYFVTADQFNQMKKKKHSRLCGDLGCLMVHVNHL